MALILTEVATGNSDIPYNNLENLGVQIYGMPAGIQFHSPLLYTQQQLQQILANLEKIVFLKIGSHDQVQEVGHEQNVGTFKCSFVCVIFISRIFAPKHSLIVFMPDLCAKFTQKDT